LQIKDMAITGAELLQSRDEALRDALLAQQGIFGRDKLGHEHRQVLWLGFDSTTYELGGRSDAADGQAGEDAADASPDADVTKVALVPQFNDPVGQSTSLRTAIDQALQRVAGRPI